jgi:hypothetical protein
MVGFDLMMLLTGRIDMVFSLSRKSFWQIFLESLLESLAPKGWIACSQNGAGRSGNKKAHS